MKSFQFLIILFFTLCGVYVNAYVLPSAYIVKSWITKRGITQNIKIKSLLKIQSDQSIYQITTNIESKSDKIKVKINNEKGAELYFVERRISHASPLAAMLFSNSSETISRVLKNFKVEVTLDSQLESLADEAARRQAENTFLTRDPQNRPLLAIGTKDQNYVAFDKENLLLAAINESQGQSISTDEYKNFKNGQFPRKIVLKSKMSEEWLELKELDQPENTTKSDSGWTPLGKQLLQNQIEDIEIFIRNFK